MDGCRMAALSLRILSEVACRSPFLREGSCGGDLDVVACGGGHSGAIGSGADEFGGWLVDACGCGRLAVVGVGILWSEGSETLGICWAACR